MFPIRDHNPSSRTPYVTYALMAVNIAVFLLYWPTMTDTRTVMQFFDTWAMRPVTISAGMDWHTVVTSMFLHGGWMHIIGNMLFLWIFGDNMEDEMGHFSFFTFYMACGIGAALAHVAAAPFSQVPTVGASGAIAGVMGGYLLLFPRARVDVLVIFIIFFRIFPVPAWAMLGLWFGLQVFNGVGADLNGGGVAYWAHAGGFVIGLALTLPLFLRRGGSSYWARTRGLPPHPEAKYTLQRSNIPTVRRRR
ncbi:rhomboid family intramembrane serine protease [Lutimaribacter sp. EGI FJ00015]|uniref:Rhomboid family intramembrane serine protease n=1 Tax=Lutimaribacter degradans TaxID=2945989 RepID=A0ACC5ZSF2_9RHOB|nr:rhomboid family intramembrane serine protease [Lutimaribacter sp. EGI FJ00013]MCM2560706.1 rhomboid family intramembrane serine protease [Lutimaribacter sp. EGI FJ00013]MCO0612350.1 rhomboid family intramembrane serine protease [Lutimaribacter sp. EGI FJ00015]MCO0634530.1 rhomboid family intramembrane serine protease [Lutimaribacter sp. EGI FJ00014]